MALDNFPVTAHSVARFFGLKGCTLNRYYKFHLSDFEDWDQKDHAKDWVLLAHNVGEKCSIDETTLCDEVYTIFSNKAGHGKKGTIIACVRGTKAEVVSAILLKKSLEERSKVKEVTMDFSDSMYSIVKTCFPNATIVIDCFHIIQRLCEGLDEMRLRFKRPAVTETKKAEAEFKQKEEEKAKKRAYKENGMQRRMPARRNPLARNVAADVFANKSISPPHSPMVTQRLNCLPVPEDCCIRQAVNGVSHSTSVRRFCLRRHRRLRRDTHSFVA